LVGQIGRDGGVYIIQSHWQSFVVAHSIDETGKRDAEILTDVRELAESVDDDWKKPTEHEKTSDEVTEKAEFAVVREDQ
jgi:hypothetical protein